ncbi:collagen-like triple helix repeat-containing protein [Burkholderia seminalis]|uniref:collagen-like triple helix repeat-containing protein n=1 Tax=Burkholderia seminalis TaxID=488731 RepID=UPI0034512790
MDAGTTLAGVTLPGVSRGVTAGPADTVTGVGTIINRTSNVVSAGLGQIGIVPNPVGTTVAGLGDIVASTSNPVSGLSETVKALGTGPLSPLSPLTTPVGGLLDTVSSGLSKGGATLGAALSSGPVQQATQTISTAITPLVTTAGQLTQQVGTATGLGQPVAGLLGQVGAAITSAGWKVSAASSQPLVGGVGTLVRAVGNTVTNVGGLVNPAGANGAVPISGLVTSVVGGISATVHDGPATGAGGGTPLGGLANPLAPVTSLVGGLLGGLAGK